MTNDFLINCIGKALTLSLYIHPNLNYESNSEFVPFIFSVGKSVRMAYLGISALQSNSVRSD